MSSKEAKFITGEDVFRRLPELNELVDLWMSWLEYWSKSGGFGPGEVEEAQSVISKRAQQLLDKHYPGYTHADSYSRLAREAAMDINNLVTKVAPEDLHV